MKFIRVGGYDQWKRVAKEITWIVETNANSLHRRSKIYLSSAFCTQFLKIYRLTLKSDIYRLHFYMKSSLAV